MVAQRKGYRLSVVMPDNASDERDQLLELFGAEIVFTPATRGRTARSRSPGRWPPTPPYFMPFQYGNRANPLAHYEGTGGRDHPRPAGG